MSSQRYSNNNDKFEFKLNTKSTPKKTHNYNEASDKSSPIDAIYSEITLLKENNVINYIIFCIYILTF